MLEKGGVMVKADSGKVEKLEKINLSEAAFDAMEKKIASGIWAVNKKIPSEPELASGFGISRIVLREALARLRGAGYIEVRTGEGTFVSHRTRVFSIGDGVPLTSILQFRYTNEPECAFLAASKDSDTTEMGQIFEEMLKLPPEDIDNYARLDCEFHIAIARATENPLFASIIDTVLGRKYGPTMVNTIQIIGKETANADHQALYEAIKTKNADRAKEVMQEHLAKVIRGVPQQETRKLR
jgi:DNA-binding FadR family transcriptional regulator